MKGMGLLLILAIVVSMSCSGSSTRPLLPPRHDPVGAAVCRVGAILTLMISGRAFHLRLCRIIMLVGLVKSNGIMMVDFAVEAQRGGLPPVEAIHQACMIALPAQS